MVIAPHFNSAPERSKQGHRQTACTIPFDLDVSLCGPNWFWLGITIVSAAALGL